MELVYERMKAYILDTPEAVEILEKFKGDKANFFESRYNYEMVMNDLTKKIAEVHFEKGDIEAKILTNKLAPFLSLWNAKLLEVGR